MQSEGRRHYDSRGVVGGAFLASDVMLLTYHLSQISKDDILLYKLDRLNLLPVDSSSNDVPRSSSGHIIRLHDRLQCHLEETTLRLLSEYANLELVDIDTNRIAQELEHFCVDRSSISLRRLKAMLYTGMRCFNRLPATLQLLLSLKDTAEKPPVSCPIRDAEGPVFHDTGDCASNVPDEATSSSDDGMDSCEDVPATTPEPGHVSSSVITDRFEFSEIDEDDLVSDILFVVQGIEGRFIKRGVDGTFSLTSRRQVSRGVRQLTNRMCSLGLLYNSIMDFRPSSGAISQALHQAVMDEVHQYNHLINMLVTSRANDRLTLRRLYVLLQQPYNRMRLLYMALGTSSVRCIDRIFDLYCSRGDAMGRELYSELLRKCMISFLEILLRWVYYGELDDVSGVFFVGHTEGRYNIISCNIPTFISPSLAELCFDTGCCSKYYFELSPRSGRGTVDITGFLKQLCPASTSWSIFVTIQQLSGLVRSIDTSVALVRELVLRHDLSGYLRRISDHLSLVHLGGDPLHPVFDDFECNKDFGFDMYVPRFSFPVSLVFNDVQAIRDLYINSFRMEFLLQRTLKLLSLCWKEYSVYSRYCLGSLDLSRRMIWINLCRNEMSHFANMLQKSRNVPYILDSFIRRVSSRDYPPAGTTLKDLRDEWSATFGRLEMSNFLEVMEILESIVDYCKFALHLFNRGMMRELRDLVCDNASPSVLTEFIHGHIVTNEVMDVFRGYAKRFRESVILLLHRLSCENTDSRMFGVILDYNNFYRLLSAIES
ncbi:Spc97 / Spc98 family protein [Babesia bovis T2Bo]|uniref:Gamma tubulin complex component protein N-terminal domain-containing protein n=1 Tax=Babesia bovis TaxID=5865 RepID=A7AV98_BABBO|nr:Spc97 / Spc98 family protein [Babesia bovis T2Bo]EDO05724.1 Spc97 / Spc98 family protein [Babesia bovis T2Bo]|eukprot:XP_001609292.1 hypothetical protein [Babesia bovis T2Bo]